MILSSNGEHSGDQARRERERAQQGRERERCADPGSD